MSEHFSAGVKIILARIESHPEEFKELHGRWGDIMEAVRIRATGKMDRLPALTDEEVHALHDKLREHIWRPDFNDMVMSKVLDPEREERQEQHNLAQTKIYAGGGMAMGAGIRPSMLQNSVLQPGAIVPMPYEEPKTPTLISRVGKAIGIK
jgi:hypothetical protein